MLPGEHSANGATGGAAGAATESMTIRVMTGSMAPAIRAGDLVTVERREPDPGDVAAFIVGESIVVHRVLARWPTSRGAYFLHRGDAAEQSGVFKDHQLVGVVAGMEARPPEGFEAVKFWYLGRAARIGADLARSPVLRPVYNWLVMVDGKSLAREAGAKRGAMPEQTPSSQMPPEMPDARNDEGEGFEYMASAEACVGEDHEHGHEDAVPAGLDRNDPAVRALFGLPQMNGSAARNGAAKRGGGA
jgi:hypothetical protein